MEKMFKTRWWDYSKRKFNINGRVCLRNSIMFGVLGMLVVTIISPYIMSILNNVPGYVKNIILGVLFIFLLIDIVISYTVMHKIKIAADDIKKEREYCANNAYSNAPEPYCRVFKRHLYCRKRFSKR